MASSSHSSSLYTYTAQSGPSDPLLLMQPSHPILAFKPPIPLPPTSYFLPLHPHHRFMLLAIFLYFLFSLPLGPLRVLQWNAGGLRARSTELLHFNSSHPVDLICTQESNLNLSSFFQVPVFSSLRSDRTHFQSGIFLLMPPALAAASLFLLGRAYGSLNFLPSLFLRLTPTLNR